MGTDPFETQRDPGVDMAVELCAAGFEDAEEIGRGKFSAVYRCTQPHLDRPVAVKVLLRELAESQEQFVREQRVLGRLTGHPNIVGVLEVGETTTGLPYLVMPYYSEGSLAALIRRDGPLPLDGVLSIGVRLAGALHTAHRASVLHRDVEPANILVTEHGEPALSDFGIAHEGEIRTAVGTVTGSPAFTAPEVLGGAPNSPASDVYGLGATLFCALTGHAMFDRRRSGESVVSQFLRIAAQPPLPDLREHGIPEDMCAVIEAAMSRDPHDRPTAAILGEKLQRVQRAHGFGLDHMALQVEHALPISSIPDEAAPMPRPSVGVRSSTGNLPVELTSFVDRRAQVAEVKNLLSASCLVTLTGIGGAGKSRLALRVAHKLQQSFAGGVWLVELAEVRDPLLLTDVVAATLGLRPVGRPALEVLVEYLSTHETLLVLDNCEHMVEAVAKLVESLLRACPPLRILATSREHLRIGGESVMAVPPLTFPEPARSLSVRSAAGYEAVTLFAERAAAVVPGFRVDDDNWAGVAEICARLDGLPLAIELAAARLNTMSVEEISARLTERFTVLTRGSRDAPTRQQTLGWCIGWSYDLCTPTEQSVWGRLSVFAGSFALDAAEYVCGADLIEPELLDALSALIDKSIVIREQTGTQVRFRMLETVQEYGRQKLIETGAHREPCRRHRDWYGRLVLWVRADWVSSRQLRWITLLESELPNLRKALESSLSERDPVGLRSVAALFSFWFSTGRLSEGRRWCNRVLAAGFDAPAAQQAETLTAASVFAAQLGDLPGATARVAQMRILAEQTADPWIGAALAYADGVTALNSGDLDRARTRFNDAAREFTIDGDILFELRALVVLGWTLVLQEEMTAGIACLEQLLTIANAHGEKAIRSLALRPMALAVWRQGDGERAAQLLQEALGSARELADPLVAAVGLEISAWISGAENEPRRAAVLLGAAQGLGHTVGSSIMFPHMVDYHTQCERRIRDVLGERGFEAAYREGATMSLETAVGFAVEERPETAKSVDHRTTLTKREREVVDLIAEGLTNKAIAARLVIAPRTAQGHVEHILTKLGFTSRAQVAAWAVEHADERPA